MAKPNEEQMMTIVGIIEPMRLRGLVDAQAQQIGAYYSSLRQVAGAHARRGDSHGAGAGDA